MSNAPHELDLTAEKRKFLAETRADLLKRQLSNSENYDKAVLSLSTAFLGLSLAFLKDILPLQSVKWLSLLYGSWGVLAGAVVATIVSFWVGQRGIDDQIKKAEDYYLRDDPTALTKSGFAKATGWVNAASGVLFVLGVLLTIAFVIANIERELKMGNDKKTGQVPLREGATIPNMQKVPAKKAAPIPNLQPMPQSQPPAQSKLRADNTIEPVKVILGITDHSYTALGQVVIGELREGDNVITGEVPGKNQVPGASAAGGPPRK